MDNIIRTTPDPEKAKSILKMVDNTLEMISEIDIERFPSIITKEYYECIRELMTIILLKDGYKTYGEGSHKAQIEYLKENHDSFTGYEIHTIEELRKLRNKISYDGFFIEKEYIARKSKTIKKIIKKLKEMI